MSLLPNAARCSPPRILVVRLGAMGDIIQTLPAVADLRRGVPDARIAWAVDSRWRELLAGNQDIDEVISLRLRAWLDPGSRPDERAGGALRRMRRNDFDLALDMQGLIKSAAVAAASNAKTVAGLDHSLLREPHAALLYDRRIKTAETHVIDRYRELAAMATGFRPLPEARFQLPSGELRSGLPERFVLTSAQAGWGAKQWPRERYSELAARLWNEHRIPLVVDCAPGGEALANAIRDAAPEGAVHSHPSTLSQLIGATRRAAAVVGVDSGPLHLAAALARPGVAIFGPTDPARNGPHGSSMTVLRAADAATTYKRTAEPSPSMRAWSADAVYRELVARLNSVD
ncbi:MAG: lipopolysaccharide heptosyltransferase I [Acidobacteriia bacterium]|nr:lipopolysaccharide heptosyltransferase I [Terriglobia bacterium]MYG02213.1 lipopolysaccharide heptosyltransferase I [Terriglobia bacterium]MYK10316.1 lipopolysaccharide heptosyltransferase I [Terriglobia bacterium]